MTTLLYGIPPSGLVDVPNDAIQCSPLIPGSTCLEAIAENSIDGAIVYAPPGTHERRYTLALALRALKEGGTLIALGANDKGGNRIQGELEEFGSTVALESRSHHRITTTKRPAMLYHLDEAIAEGALRQYPDDHRWTQPGIFSWDRIDPGSALLLNHLPPCSGRGADLGCGIGILAQAVLQSPTVTELHLIDIDRRAVKVAQKNIIDPRAQFHWADLREPSPLTDLDFIVMNPPFHDAGIEDKTLGQRLIIRAASMLKPHGQLWLTANQHLPYEPVLKQHFKKTRPIAETEGFKLYQAEK